MKANQQKVYEKIGHLFYSIVAADGKIKSSEVDALKKLVSEEWDPAETSRDQFDTDLAEYIYITFDFLITQEVPAKEAFEIFRNYFEEHPSLFTEELVSKILRSARVLAASASASHKVEDQYINQLSKLIKRKATHA